MYFKTSTLLHIIKVMGMVSFSSAGLFDSTVRVNNGGQGGNSGVGVGNGGTSVTTTVGEVKCVIQRIEYAVGEDDDDDVDLDNHPSSTIGCVMEPEYESGIQGIMYDVDESTLPHDFYDGDEAPVFSETQLTISSAIVKRNQGKGGTKHGGGTLSIEPGATVVKGKKKEKVKNSVRPKRNLRGNDDRVLYMGTSSGRQLSQKTGVSTLIVLYAIPLDVINDERTSIQLANDIFGINTTEVRDEVNVKTQMLACSGGKLDYIPACGTEEQTCSSPLITNGVLEVPINENVTGVTSGTVVNWVKAEAQVILNGTGIDIFAFDQIMVVAPDEAEWGSAAAWAYMPGQISAFRDDYAYRVGIQMHEFGHNLGLTHSGYDGQEYRDHSCTMGSPSAGDDGPEVCFNGAKSFELGWYASESDTVDPSISSSFDLVGVGDWANGVFSDHNKVVIEIKMPEEPLDYSTCGTYTSDQADYRGDISVTESGKNCMDWAPPSPPSNELVIEGNNGSPAEAFPLNKCQGDCDNDSECARGLYCFQRDALESVPGCSGSGESKKDYCAALVDTYPDASLESNFCRNPDGKDGGAYCFTTDPDTPWEYCNVPYCSTVANQPLYYVMYNRAKGGNSGVSFHKDEVTVTLGGAGPSWHLAGLGAPNPTENVFPLWRQPNFNGGNKDLVVKVCNIAAGEEGVTPDTASILIYLDDGAAYNNGEMCPGEVGCISDAQCDDGNWCTENTCNLQTNTCNSPVDISASLCPTCGDETFCNAAGFCDDVCNDGKSCSSDSCVLDQCQHDPIPGCAVNGGQLETWYNIGGNKVTHLTRSMSYLNNPPDEVTILRDSLKADENRGSDFGARLQTYIHPSSTGIYNFYVASDDYSELYLSTNEDPLNKSLIAYVNGYSGLGIYDKFPTQKSVGIFLEVGSVYYLEAFHKEGGGYDHLSVAWESTDASIPLTVIGESNFFLEAPVACNLDSDCAALVTNPCTAGYCNIATTFCEYEPMPLCQNGAKFDQFYGLSGSSLDSLTSDTKFPDSPDDTSILSESLETPSNVADSYGSRLQTYIMPPFTCDFNFYIAANQRGQLNLSNDTSPLNKVTVAWLDSSTNPQEWYKYTSQKSDPIRLEKGNMYYLEALHTDWSGRDNLAVAWECVKYGMAVEVIDGTYTAVSPPVAEPTTSTPTTSPSKAPSHQPTSYPTSNPSSVPTSQLTNTPTAQPTNEPTTSKPTVSPSLSPVTSKPTASPSSSPVTAKPTTSPSLGPSSSPTAEPSNSPTSSPSRLPTSSPTVPPSLSPSIQPTRVPTSSPVTNELIIAGDNGVAYEGYTWPLQECQGDCDYDSDCEGDLLCYQRSGTLAVPGCVGAGTSGKDYCAKRATDNTLFLRRNNGNMGACDGNCQEDTDCEGNLVCESPNGSGEVEGCIGLAISSVKYCKYPSLVQSQSFPLGVCEGSCANDGDCQGSLECFFRIGTEDVPGCLGGSLFDTPGGGYCTTRPPNSLWVKAAVDSSPLGVCEGGCNEDSDCDGSINLICQVRTGDEEVPGCEGAGRSGVNYCRFPSLEFVGSNPVTSDPETRLGLCQGDCDNDSDCTDGLRCFQRSATEDVVGCAGADFMSGYDFCAYRPTDNTLFLVDNNLSETDPRLELCEGDCDSDNECAGDLTCFQRSGTEEVPGCLGLGANNKDYCH